MMRSIVLGRSNVRSLTIDGVNARTTHIQHTRAVLIQFLNFSLSLSLYISLSGSLAYDSGSKREMRTHFSHPANTRRTSGHSERLSSPHSPTRFHQSRTQTRARSRASASRMSMNRATIERASVRASADIQP